MKKRILIVVYVLLLCVTASFAWLSNIQETNVKSVNVDFENAMITDFSLDAELKIDPSYVETSDEEKNDESGIKLSGNSTLPGSRIPFEIVITRDEKAEKKSKLFLDLELDEADAEILKFIYVEVVYTEVTVIKGEGNKEEYSTKSRHVFKRLLDSEQGGYYGDYSVEIFGEGNEIIIPPQRVEKENSPPEMYVTLNCSFYYSDEATATCQDMGIDAMVFRMER